MYYVVLGSFYDQCLAKNGTMYKKDDGEFGCYYFHSKHYYDSKEYDYDRSKEFCEGIGGSLPIIKSEEEDKNMLRLLNGYVSRVNHNL